MSVTANRKFTAQDEEILESLNESEVNELAIFLSDLDTNGAIELTDHVPPSERTTYHVDKAGADTYDRNKLLNFLDKQAAQYQPKDHYEPYTGEKKGKPWRPKKEIRTYGMRGDQGDKKGAVAEEWENLIDAASDEDLADMAALLGLGHLVNQDQYQAAQQILAEDRKTRLKPGEPEEPFLEENVSLKNTGRLDTLTPSKVKLGIVKMDIPAKLGGEVNMADVEDIINRSMDNDQSLTEINLNNIKNISKERFVNLFNALKQNRVVKRLLLANTRMEDCVGFALADMMRQNDVIEVLNVESNFLTGAGGLIRLCDAVEMNTTLKELRLANQFTGAGHATEMRIADMLQVNKTILKFGFNFDAPGPRNIATTSIQRNVEISRQIRRGDLDDSARQPVARNKDDRFFQQLEKKAEQMQQILTKMIEVEQKQAEKNLMAKQDTYKERMKDMIPRWERLGIPDPRKRLSADLTDELSGLMDEDDPTTHTRTDDILDDGDDHEGKMSLLFSAHI